MFSQLIGSVNFSNERNIFFRYVKIVGTHNTVNRVFHLVSFECLYSNAPFQLDNGILGECQ